MSRPTEEVLEDADWTETGRCGCLIPDPDVTEDSEGDDDED
jgi:hypothetical protein